MTAAVQSTAGTSGIHTLAELRAELVHGLMPLLDAAAALAAHSRTVAGLEMRANYSPSFAAELDEAVPGWAGAGDGEELARLLKVVRIQAAELVERIER